MAWFYLILAGALEACWIFSLKLLSFTKLKMITLNNFNKQEGLAIWLPLAGYIIFGIANTYFLTLAMKNIPTAIAFTIWTAISILLIKCVETAYWHLEISVLEIVFLLLILIGVVGLKLISKY